jgi:hypothetical protein
MRILAAVLVVALLALFVLDERERRTTRLLRRARALIERGWTRSACARDPNGKVVCPTDKSAICWCAQGALIAEGVPESRGFWAHAAVERFLTALGGEGITVFNDRKGLVEPVLAAFDRAIAAGGR